MSYHDIYWVDEEEGWPKIDADRFVTQLRDALKPGGHLLIVDHAAKAGTGSSAAQDLHRIDEAFAEEGLHEPRLPAREEPGMASATLPTTIRSWSSTPRFAARRTASRSCTARTERGPQAARNDSEERGGIVAALERLDERGAHDDAVRVGREPRDLLGAPDAEARAHRQRDVARTRSR